MHTVPQNKDKFTINNLFYCCEALIFTHPLVYEFLCGPKYMATPVVLMDNLSTKIPDQSKKMLIFCIDQVLITRNVKLLLFPRNIIQGILHSHYQKTLLTCQCLTTTLTNYERMELWKESLKSGNHYHQHVKIKLENL